MTQPKRIQFPYKEVYVNWQWLTYEEAAKKLGLQYKGLAAKVDEGHIRSRKLSAETKARLKNARKTPIAPVTVQEFRRSIGLG